MSYRDTASFGKRQEYIIIAELLRQGFDVYMTLVDDQGIDCIIRLDESRYIDVQIKARSDEAKCGTRFAGLNIEPRPNYFFIFYTQKNDTIWVIPSLDLIDMAYRNPGGANVGKYTINLPDQTKGQKSEKFEKYKGNKGVELLREYRHGLKAQKY
jgi:hypothetical protein